MLRVAAFAAGLVATGCSSAFSQMPQDDQDRWSWCHETILRAQCRGQDAMDRIVCGGPLLDQYTRSSEDSESRIRMLQHWGCPLSMLGVSEAPAAPATPRARASSSAAADREFVQFDTAAVGAVSSWWCIGAQLRGVCVVDRALCESARREFIDTGRVPPSDCRPRDPVWCLSFFDQERQTLGYRCVYGAFPEITCSEARDRLIEHNRAHGVRYRLLSRCAPVAPTGTVGDASARMLDATATD